MSEQPTQPVEDDAPEAQHLEVEPYGDDERAVAPEWYDRDAQ